MTPDKFKPEIEMAQNTRRIKAQPANNQLKVVLCIGAAIIAIVAFTPTDKPNAADKIEKTEISQSFINVTTMNDTQLLDSFRALLSTHEQNGIESQTMLHEHATELQRRNISAAVSRELGRYILYTAQDSRQAIQWLNRSLTQAPNDMDTLALLAYVYVITDDLAMAEQTINHALTLTTAVPPLILLAQGDLAAKHKYFAKAESYYKQAQKHDQSSNMIKTLAKQAIYRLSKPW